MVRYVFEPPRDSSGDQVYPGIPRELGCGLKYVFTIRVNKKVADCRGANYRDVYDRAKAAATDRANLIHCSRGCGPKRVWQEARQWGCDFRGNDLVVFAVVQYAVVCPWTPGTGHGERGLAEPNPESFGEPRVEPNGHAERDFENAHEFIEIDYDELDPLNCGANIRKINFEQSASDDCSSYQKNTRQFTENALTAAFIFSQFLHCPGPCSTKILAGLTVLGSGCASGTASISVQIIVLCV